MLSRSPRPGSAEPPHAQRRPLWLWHRLRRHQHPNRERVAAGLQPKASLPGLLYFLHLLPGESCPSLSLSSFSTVSPSGLGVRQSKDQPNVVVIV